MRILVLGASGMLGSAMMHILSENDKWDVVGSVRSNISKKYFPERISSKLEVCCDVKDLNMLNKLFDKIRPDIVINCVSLSKQHLSELKPLLLIPVYALLPHQLSKMCENFDARLIHISTDAVFSGAKGMYTENDIPDAYDLYGTTKLIGEVHCPNTINIRTSIIGHELNSSNGLLEWFLQQKVSCKCFSNAIFSGLPTVVLAQIVRDIVIPRKKMHGVYHIASKPVSKCELLNLIAKVYNKSIAIISDDKVKINRSLNADRFNKEVGCVSLDWEQLANIMYSHYISKDFKSLT